MERYLASRGFALGGLPFGTSSEFVRKLACFGEFGIAPLKLIRGEGLLISTSCKIARSVVLGPRKLFYTAFGSVRWPRTGGLGVC
jgi:hypothetical protein